MKLLLTLSILALLLTTSTFSKTKWYTHLDSVKVEAAKTNKPILVNFTGSDWCVWCKRLKSEVFITEDFDKYANENLTLLELDFPNKSNQSQAIQQYNKSLMESFGVEGFPALFLLTPNGEIVGRLGYMEGGPAAFFNYLGLLYSSYVPTETRERVGELFESKKSSSPKK